MFNEESDVACKVCGKIYENVFENDKDKRALREHINRHGVSAGEMFPNIFKILLISLKCNYLKIKKCSKRQKCIKEVSKVVYLTDLCHILVTIKIILSKHT